MHGTRHSNHTSERARTPRDPAPHSAGRFRSAADRRVSMDLQRSARGLDIGASRNLRRGSDAGPVVGTRAAPVHSTRATDPQYRTAIIRLAGHKGTIKTA